MIFVTAVFCPRINVLSYFVIDIITIFKSFLFCLYSTYRKVFRAFATAV